jgi:NADPH:quinone reductase-like Zn-dependent oxidoreductase
LTNSCQRSDKQETTIMRAVAIGRAGDAPELAELPIPRPGPGEVLVKLAAASINPIDAAIAQGAFEGRMAHIYPLVPGVDGAGQVTVTGEDVRGFRVGDNVHGQFLRTPIGHGTFAEYALVTESPDSGALQRTPDGMSAEIAAALPTAGMTAVGVLDAIGLRAGQSILIVGATGGVGVFAVQLAAARGAQVIATARPAADQWIRKLGATETVDYTTGDMLGQLRETHCDGVDAVIDLTRDPGRFTELAGLVRDGGAASSASLTASPELLASERISVTNFMMRDKPGLLARITDEAASGRITVPIQQTVTLDRVPEALAHNTAGGARGKTTISI